MLIRSWKTAAIAASLALCLAVPAVARATKSTQKVSGKLTTDVDGSEAEGKFKFKTLSRRDRVREYMDIWMRGLDATADENDDLPVYDVWLINEDGDVEADFGDVKLRENGKARFKFRSSRDDYPDDVDEVRDFSGGTVEIRDADDGVVLSAAIPDYLGLDDENEEGSHSRVRAHGSKSLSAPDDSSRARGHVGLAYANRPSGSVEKLLVVAKRLERGTQYTVVAIDDDDNDAETEVGTFRAFSRAGVGVLSMDSRQGTDIPGGGALGLSGQKLEIRDGDGNVVLKGRFPTLL